MRLIQCSHQDQIRSALVESDQQVRLLDADTYTLAMCAIRSGKPLSDIVESSMTESRLDYQQLINEKRLLPPLTHTDPAHCLVTGTGLTHLGCRYSRCHACQSQGR